MAIYYLDVRGVAPSRGASPVASAAYQSGETLVDERTGERKRYGRRERVSATGIALPAHAPAWASDRAALWNRAMSAWDGGNHNRLAAERVVIALPRELSPERMRGCVADLCRTMTERGYACDWAIHEIDGANPHAHILRTALPLGQDGFVAPPKRKMTREYVCRRGTEERRIPAAEWRDAKADGWAKVYRYDTADGEARLTQAEAQARGLSNADRVTKVAVSVVSRADGTDPLAEAKADLKALRASWADIANARLADQAREDGTPAAAIDARSYAERGIDRVSTVHEGPAVTAQERRSGSAAPATDVRAHNNEIRAKNALIARLEGIVADLREGLRALRRPRTRGALAAVMDGLAPALSPAAAPPPHAGTARAAAVAAALAADARLARHHVVERD